MIKKHLSGCLNEKLQIVVQNILPGKSDSINLLNCKFKLALNVIRLNCGTSTAIRDESNLCTFYV